MELKEGIIKGLDFELYNAIPALRSSGIEYLKTPRRYWYHYISNQKKDEEEKIAQIIGSALHTLVLEPQYFFNRYTIYPSGIDRRTKEGKRAYEEFLGMSFGKRMLKQEQYDEIQAMANSMKSHPKFEVIFNRLPNPCIEDSLIWQFDKDIWFKSRPDFYNDEVIVDIKTTNGESEEDFIKSILKWGYHRQAAMQIDSLSYLKNKKYKHHILFVVEKSPPYLCAMYSLDEIAINQGRNEYNEAAKIYAECIKNKNWPGYSEDVIEANLPEWYLRNN